MTDLASARVFVDREAVRRGGLYEFGRRAWHIVEPSQPFVGNWHIPQICRMAEHCIVGDEWAIRQAVNVPPGTGKSLWLSVFLPAWIWTFWPGFRSIYASYDIGVSRRDARRTLAILESDWYKARWPAVKVRYPTSETRIETTEGGVRYSTSVESKVTGQHGHLRVVDDPIKSLDAMGGAEASGIKLAQVVDWWRGTMSTRVLDPSAARYLLIMQRLHEADLTGYLTGDDTEPQDRPIKVVFPMHYDPTDRFECVEAGLVDIRTKPGELLWPARYPEKAVEALERSLGAHASAQLEQKPTAKSGDLFRDQDIQVYDEDPRELARRATRVVLTADCAFKDRASSDRVAIQVWAEMHELRRTRSGREIGHWFALLYCQAERMGFDATCKAVRSIGADWKVGEKLIEDKANGSAVIETLSREVDGIVPINPAGGKLARAHAVQTWWRGEQVWVMREGYCPGLTVFRAEHKAFPRGKHDDTVDAGTQALTHMGGRGLSMLDLYG